MKLAPARLDVWIWALIYGGLLFAVVGLALQRNRESYGWGVVMVGALAVVAGAVLLWLRSRMREPQP